MTTPRIIPPEVSRVQVQAADPDVSAFVSANAGSGKTYVLAQQQVDHALRQHVGLARAGIGGHEGRDVRIGGVDLHAADVGWDDAGGGHACHPILRLAILGLDVI